MLRFAAAALIVALAAPAGAVSLGETPPDELQAAEPAADDEAIPGLGALTEAPAEEPPPPPPGEFKVEALEDVGSDGEMFRLLSSAGGKAGPGFGARDCLTDCLDVETRLKAQQVFRAPAVDPVIKFDPNSMPVRRKRRDEAGW